MATPTDPNRVGIVIATSEDWERVRDIRIRAIADAPFAFASRWDEEKDRPQSFWRARLGQADAATFLALSGNETVGVVTAFVAPEDAARTELVSMWVASGARGQRVGRQLVAAVIDWALRHGAASVGLWVTEMNVPARRLYESCGFVYSRERQSLPSDPSLSEVEMRLVLGR